MAKPAIVVQGFVKADTLAGLGQSLLACEGREQFDLIFYCDIPGGDAPEPYEALSRAVAGFATDFCARHGSQFASCSLVSNSENQGTCRTCRSALDHAFQDHDFVIFTEDDTIFSSDALQWFLTCAESDAFKAEQTWAIAGESICFNAEGRSVDDDFVTRARRYIREHELLDAFTTVGFLPSTCFATNARKWSQFCVTRGQRLGDEDVNARCQAEGRRCIMPIVPRVKDVGMLHPLGFSVTIHTAAGVKEIKNTYVLSQDIETPRATVRPFHLHDGAGEAWRRSSSVLDFD